MKTSFSYKFTAALFIAECLVLLYGAIAFVWKKYYNYLLDREGQKVIATIYRKDNGFAYYDIEYDGSYYRSYISLTKSAFRKIQVGERFPALILPDKLKYYHENGITPRSFKIILTPLPDYLQDFDKERIRISAMYGYRIRIPHESPVDSLEQENDIRIMYQPFE